jgi:hypothetical protein
LEPLQIHRHLLRQSKNSFEVNSSVRVGLTEILHSCIIRQRLKSLANKSSPLKRTKCLPIRLSVHFNGLELKALELEFRAGEWGDARSEFNKDVCPPTSWSIKPAPTSLKSKKLELFGNLQLKNKNSKLLT